MNPAGLLLAAGAGRRFGGPKALVRYDGELLADRAVRMLHDAGCAPVVVVLGAAVRDVVAQAELADAVVLVNEGWSAGIGSSLQVGLTALGQLGAPAAVVALVDQPGVGPDVVRRLAAAWAGGAVAAVASYGGRPRNPVLLDAAVWPEVSAAAHDDVGAREWLRANPERVVVVACDDIGTDADIDTRADLDRLVEGKA